MKKTISPLPRAIGGRPDLAPFGNLKATSSPIGVVSEKIDRAASPLRAGPSPCSDSQYRADLAKVSKADPKWDAFA
ncbi:hypothetical protein MPC4_210053 [Methylocella tundrae]|uniref:Uncharacterized protein n=1 Tax=Methylocella tundrae TaxID=227605 RepID=A0A8B6M649_METTU|nr:hypothetical protein MPC1_10120002 [Methylocella tundrae]VTZ50246.1 hypothetical protein MPC4_210053 [Methylocella tundrae]